MTDSVVDGLRRGTIAILSLAIVLVAAALMVLDGLVSRIDDRRGEVKS
jgi:hypothetical protein